MGTASPGPDVGPREEPVFAPSLSADRVTDVTRGRCVASEPDKEMFYLDP
ncbi:hypothetical protein GCM10010329_82810 [Streptomyces spiroverticillatus]|uniref:Uncharacterized protein n=1 Tax=Streptomyces finlayi TaxID=67296 RepID=A0A918X8W6_9ACTN|nr:hypothetical protein [Streptomyces finlayi]GHA47822.1 hypothetical protein GCM10010329_82810 [Streptomyces spiroverticillatus]GHD18763.1 hypothetical protein GCM10010334_81880 [Streptomyces finlayi]